MLRRFLHKRNEQEINSFNKNDRKFRSLLAKIILYQNDIGKFWCVKNARPADQIKPFEDL